MKGSTEIRAEAPWQTDEPLAAALADAARALDGARIPYVLVGGVASALLGRPRWTEDVDLLVKPKHAKQALAALAEASFDAEETNPHWIYKATRAEVTLDVIFALKGGIYLDDEMLTRARRLEFQGASVRVASPEDLVVMKAIAHDEPSAHHWNDALGMIAACELDWEYLIRRAQHGARRILSLLVYAQADDLVVPDGVIAELYRTIYGNTEGTASDGTGT